MTQTYKTIDPDALAKRDAYFLNISLLVPRPIAWVASIDRDDVPNCAPYSFFMGVSSHPPILAFSVGKKGTGLKDTARNIRKRPEFTVNICNEAMAEQMVQTSGDYPHGTSEFDEAGLEAVPSDLIAAPRIGGAPVQMECRLYKTLDIEESGATVIFGRVVRYHVDSAVLDDNGLVNIHKLKPVGRLGGQEYCRINDVFEIPRPEL